MNCKNNHSWLYIQDLARGGKRQATSSHSGKPKYIVWVRHIIYPPLLMYASFISLTADATPRVLHLVIDTQGTHLSSTCQGSSILILLMFGRWTNLVPFWPAGVRVSLSTRGLSCLYKAFFRCHYSSENERLVLRGTYRLIPERTMHFLGAYPGSTIRL